MILYLAYLVIVAWALPLGIRPRIVVTLVAVADGLAIHWLARQHGDLWTVIADWQPPLQILLGYWLSGLFFRRPMPRVEHWLAAGDRWIFDRWGLGPLIEHAPRVGLELLELAYLSVYLLPPLGFFVARRTDPSLDAAQYWGIVVAAELASYAALPWIQTRPPRALNDHLLIEGRHLAIRRLNTAVLRRGSIQVNTIPSGHAAGALATALAVAQVSPVAGGVFGVIAAGIVLGSIAGRYHYAADSVAGLAIALVIWIGSRG